jgi:hypothetical protein
VKYAHTLKLINKHCTDDVILSELLADPTYQSFLNTLYDLVENDITFFDGCHFGTIIQDLALLNSLPENVCALLENNGKHVVNTHRLSEVGKICWALGQANFAAPTFFGELLKDGEWLMEDNLSWEAISNILSGLIALRYRPAFLVNWLNAESYWYVNECWKTGRPEGLVNAAVFIATVGDEEEAARDTPNSRQRPSLIRRVNKKVPWILRKLDFHDTSALCWALAMNCAKLDTIDSNVPALWKRMIQTVNNAAVAEEMKNVDGNFGVGGEEEEEMSDSDNSVRFSTHRSSRRKWAPILRSSTGDRGSILDPGSPEEKALVHQTLVRLSHVLLVDEVERFGVDRPPAWLVLSIKRACVEFENEFRANRDRSADYDRVNEEVEQLIGGMGLVYERNVDPRSNMGVGDAKKWWILEGEEEKTEEEEVEGEIVVVGKKKKKRTRKRKGIRYQKRHPEEFYDSPGFLLLDLTCPSYQLGLEVVPETRFCLDPGTGLFAKDGIATTKAVLLKRMQYNVAFITLDTWNAEEDKDGFVRQLLMSQRWDSVNLYPHTQKKKWF